MCLHAFNVFIDIHPCIPSVPQREWQIYPQATKLPFSLIKKLFD